MGLFYDSKGKPIGKLAASRAKAAASQNPMDDLVKLANSLDLSNEANKIINKEPKLSPLQRIAALFNTTSTATAVGDIVDNPTAKTVVTAYPKHILKSLAAAVTGKEKYTAGNESYADVLKGHTKVKNKYASGALGFIGDVALDPLTWFGSGLVKTPIKALEKIPAVGKALKTTDAVFDPLKDALGKAFVYGYKTDQEAVKGAEILAKAAKNPELYPESVIARATKGIEKSFEEKMKVFTPKDNKLWSTFGKEYKDAGITLDKVSHWSQLPDIDKKLSQFSPKAREILTGSREITIPGAAMAKPGEVVSNGGVSFDEKIKVMVDKGYRKNDLFQMRPGEFDTLYKKETSQIVPTRGWKKDVRYGTDLYHETSPNNALMISGSRDSTIDTIPVTNSKDLAIGQGGKGVQLIFDPRKAPVALKGERAHKPSAGFLHQQGLTDELMLSPSQAEQGWIKGVVVKKGTPDTNQPGGLVKSFFTNTGLDPEKYRVLPNGDKVYDQFKPSIKSPGVGEVGGVKATEQTGKLGLLDRSYAVARQSGLPDNKINTFYSPGSIKGSTGDILTNMTKEQEVGSMKYKGQVKLENQENPLTGTMQREQQYAKNRIIDDFRKRSLDKITDPTKKAATEDHFKMIFGDKLTGGYGAIDALAKASGLDKFNQLFKAMVTSPFLAFHDRNYAMGILQNYAVLGIRAFSPKAVAGYNKMAHNIVNGVLPKGPITVAGKIEDAAITVQPFIDRFMGTTRYGEAELGALSKKITTLQRINPLSAQNQMLRYGRWIGDRVETRQKLAAYYTALEMKKSVPEALDLAERAGFDYSKITPFEASVMKRIIPFYSFARKNAELQLRTIGDNPERIANMFKGFQAFENIFGQPKTEEESKYMPDFIKEGLGIKLTNAKDGKFPLFVGNIGTPIEAFADLFKGTKSLSMITGPIKFPLEALTGFEFFRGRPIKDNYNASEFKSMPKFVKDFLELKETKPKHVYVNGVKTDKTYTSWAGDAKKIHFLRTLNIGQRFITTASDISQEDKTILEKLLKTTTGIRPQQVNVESQKYFNEKDIQTAIEDMMIKYGEVKKLEKTYVPKEK